ncbi:7017_t:CDS:2, partial [Funneliformis geosporum]
MKHIFEISLYFLALSFLTVTTNAQSKELEGNWPALDKPPPTNESWTSLVDMLNVPNVPLSKDENDCGANDANDEFCKWSCTQCTRNVSDIVVCPNKSDWGLTFDDGPTDYTDALLDYLASKDVKLTFFVVGSRVKENPQTLLKAFKAVHTWSHSLLTTQTNEQIIAEIKWTEKAIKQAVGYTPKYMRPPLGNIDDRVRAIVTQLGYKIVIWDKDTTDYDADKKYFKAEWIEGNFTNWVKETSTTGHISLEHDLYQASAGRAEYVVPIVQGAGFNIKPVAVCLDDPNPYVEEYSLTTNNTVAKTPTVETSATVTSKNDVPTESPS